MDRPTHLWLIEIGNSDPPLYAVVKGWGQMASDEDTEFLIEERQCPSDLLGVEALISETDTDPHGVLTFIQQIETPDDWPFTGLVDYARYRAAFSALPALATIA